MNIHGVTTHGKIIDGATGALLEMMIEAETGKKPEAGTGDKLIEGYNNKWKKASIFLSMMGDIVKDPGYYRAPSGKIRHFNISKLTLLDGISQSAYDSILSSLTREARNFPMQHLVAYHMALATIKAIDCYLDMGLKARPMLYLYDALSTLCPLEERFIVKDIHYKCMSLNTTHEIHGRTLQYGIDTGLYYRLGWSPSKEESALLYDTSWRV